MSPSLEPATPSTVRTLRGAAVKLVKCETIDVEVPAMAEVIIEGVTIPGERVADGESGHGTGGRGEVMGIGLAFDGGVEEDVHLRGDRRSGAAQDADQRASESAQFGQEG